ncbi:hypothetical protein BDP27DRAFT_1435279 [Rhodocollybia butyracea]|uniref:Uncharacterized protein n=1 Tax=Rhodocollybia butyracea TaxID=206335 RepID=A0A9P5P7T0_9AGAR|nr:hypothetical protein BDP27DRAFT_1435279 [Rhodocollybia butyracea]
MVQKQDQDKHGVGMQNFQYHPDWDRFMHIASIHSPKMHEFIRKHFPGRTKDQEAKASKLPMMVISDNTFIAVCEHLQAWGYTGPINISCDDSKTLSGLRLHYDAKEMKHYLVGGVDGPIHVPDPRILNISWPILQSRRAPRQGLALDRHIPLPDTPPFAIAAIPILDSISVPLLLNLHKQVLFGLLDHGITIISYACDGTENERGINWLGSYWYVKGTRKQPGKYKTAPNQTINFAIETRL